MDLSVQNLKKNNLIIHTPTKELYLKIKELLEEDADDWTYNWEHYYKEETCIRANYGFNPKINYENDGHVIYSAQDVIDYNTTKVYRFKTEEEIGRDFSSGIKFLLGTSISNESYEKVIEAGENSCIVIKEDNSGHGWFIKPWMLTDKPLKKEMEGKKIVGYKLIKEYPLSAEIGTKYYLEDVDFPTQYPDFFEPIYEISDLKVKLGSPEFEITITPDGEILSKWEMYMDIELIEKEIIDPYEKGLCLRGCLVHLKDPVFHFGCGDGPDITIKDLKDVVSQYKKHFNK